MANEVEEPREVEGTTDDSSKTIAALNLENAKRRKDNEKLAKELQEIRDNEETARVKNSQDIEELKRFNAEQAAALKVAIENGTKSTEAVSRYEERDKTELAGLLEKVPAEFKDDVSDDTLPLSTRLNLARKLVGSKSKNLDYRPPGEPEQDTLHAKFAQAQKDGDVMAQISLKRQIAEAS